MTSSDSPESDTPGSATPEASAVTPEASAPEAGSQDEAQRAADGLKDQIAAVRDRIRQARETLTEQARRENESRTFKR